MKKQDPVIYSEPGFRRWAVCRDDPPSKGAQHPFGPLSESAGLENLFASVYRSLRRVPTAFVWGRGGGGVTGELLNWVVVSTYSDLLSYVGIIS